VRIAQVVSTFPPYMAGTGNVCYHNSLELAKLGHSVTVFTSRYPDEDYKYDDSIKVVRGRPLFRIGNAPFLPKLMALERFDIVHLHYPYIFGGELIFLNSLLRGNTLVVTCQQDLVFDGFLGGLVNGYKSVLGKRVLFRAKKIFAPSMDYVVNSSFKRLAELRKRDVIELPNGVDIEKFNPNVDCTDLRRQRNLHGRNVVLFVGALDRAHLFKRVDLLIQAFHKVNAPGAVLMIIGEGDMKHEYQQLAGSLGLSEQVIFTGTITDWDLPQYYALCDLLVLPSTRSEIFGLVLVEAMACGKPVIATNLPGVRTVVDDGINGFLVTPGDIDELAEKIQCLLENPDMRAQFGKKARQKVETRYSWKEIGRHLEEIYRGVLRDTDA